MHRIFTSKLASWVLLVTLFTALSHGVCERAHAWEGGGTAVSADQSLQVATSAADHCPCCPAEDSDHSGGCDACVNCTCHASLAGQVFALAYAPIVTDLTFYESFQHLPEVYLSRFIPPQNLS